MSDRWVSRRRASDQTGNTALPRLIYLALLGISVCVSVYLLTAPSFRVDRPRVVGELLVDADAIVEVSGLAGRSIFLVDPSEVEREVEDLRPIESAKARVTWPNGVTISVVERQPVALWKSGSSAFLVSAEGIVLGEPRGSPPKLVIRDLDERRIFIGGQVEPEVLAQAGQIRDSLATSQPVDGVYELSKLEGLAITIKLAGSSAKNPRVVFGRGEGIRQKIEVWRRLEPELATGRLKAEQVDLRIADRPYIR